MSKLNFCVLLMSLHVFFSICGIYQINQKYINHSNTYLNNLHTDIKSNLSSLNSGVNNLYDHEGKWTIGLVQTMKTYAISDDSFIFDIFNDKSLKYHHYQIYSCNDIMNKNKSLDVTFVADPFLHIINENDTIKWYLFYELKNVRSWKGEIGVSLSKDHGNSWQFLGIILIEKFHLSYPNIISIENDNNIYMIPETNEDRTVRIYTTTNKDFPFNWKLHRKKLVSLNIRWADTGIVYHNQRYYIFTTDIISKSLHIFYTDFNTTFIESEWHSHLMNPLYTKLTAYCRCAGNPYDNKYNGKIYRFAQETTDVYGVKVHIFVINKLTTNEYKETFINTIEPSMLGVNVKRIHHLNIHHLHNGVINIVFDFDTTMGSKNSDINYSNRDINHINHIIDIANKNYTNENKDDFNKLNINVNDINFIYKLPKLIHFICISDDINNDNEIDEQYRKIQNNIDKFFSIYKNDWKIILWTNKKVANVFCDNNENIEKCNFLSNVTLAKQYEVSIAIKSDVVRFMIMDKFGGMYFDIMDKFIALQNMNDIISIYINNHGLIVAEESNVLFAAYPKNKCVATANSNSMYAIKLKQFKQYYWKRAILAAYFNDDSFVKTNDVKSERHRKRINRKLKRFDMENIATELPTETLYYALYRYSRANNSNYIIQ